MSSLVVWLNENMSDPARADILSIFQPHVSQWFADVYAAPTPVQAEAWCSIAAGEHSLVVAPTGSGKTLAAFLWSLNSLMRRPGQTQMTVGKISGGGADPAPTTIKGPGEGVKVLYISPLKALGVDVERNLRAPLVGITHTAARMGIPHTEITVGVRSGDTTAAERRRLVTYPPDILITTPESLYLMLTSQAASILDGVETVIVDEIHAIAGTKRGVHLALSLERLEMRRTANRPFQRIGLSATVRPLSTVAAFLGGDRPVQIINPGSEKKWQLDVRVPVENMSDMATAEQGSPTGDITAYDPLGLAVPLPGQEEQPAPTDGSIWPHIERQLYQQIMAERSTLVFVNSRRAAERLTAKLNELYAQEHDPESLSPELRRPPAQIMAGVDIAGMAPPVIARAHHGSVSAAERSSIENQLKEGSIKAVIATSSLELGIDMGAVNLVVQVESPPSVAGGLQRVGRAGHSVGATSRGTFYPKHRADVVQTAVTVSRMREGLIEEIHVPSNALDVLTQHTVAAAAMADLDVDAWFAVVQRAHPYRTLPREAFDAVIDLASGVYPSTDFAELRPRITFDRITGTLSGRPGAQRVAVTSGGTIPDRGMFGVFLLGGGEGGRRVGELDEEMVYESRVGDVFTLGASSWRIENITKDQVQVSPAPAHTGRLPFWKGDQEGRPAELGRAVGKFRRQVLANPDLVADPALGLDENARTNIVSFLAEQQEATGVVPDEETLVFERCRDELGDWRLVLHSPFGRGVNAAWALAVGARLLEETGIDAQPVSGDDGIVLRLPLGEVDPDPGMFLFDPEEIEAIVAGQVGHSALFAARFRECAARALLLPRMKPGARSPLWQQRQRASQLLEVARKYPSFPIVLEAVRECLHDVYDLDALQEVLAGLAAKKIRIAAVTTSQPSPFASSLMFGYAGSFMYDGDTPAAEKRAAVLSLDPALLAKLLGAVELRELLDPEIIDDVDRQVRRRAPGSRARTLEELIDAVRILGPIPIDTLPEIVEGPLPDVTAAAGRLMTVRIAGVDHLALTQDAALLRDGLGVPVPAGVAASPDIIVDALAQLLRRWVRTRGPFTAEQMQQAWGLAASVAHGSLQDMVAGGDVIQGHFRRDVAAEEYVATPVLRRIRALSLAAARAATKPVSPTAFARFLPEWQQVAPIGHSPQGRGADGVYGVLAQLAGVALPASAWETLVLPSRVANYQPADLDELCHSGEILVVGAGKAGANDPWVHLIPAEDAPLLLPEGEPPALADSHQHIMEVVAGGGSHLASSIFSTIAGEHSGLLGPGCDADGFRTTLWELFDQGLLSPESFAPLRARLAAGSTGSAAHKAKRSPARGRVRLGRAGGRLPRSGRGQLAADVIGRWGLTLRGSAAPTERGVATGEAWLERYGILTRGSVMAENTPGGFAYAYRVLSPFEEAGKAIRGFFIEGLGGAQFSTPAIIDRLRSFDDSADVEGWPSGASTPDAYLLAATDPANPYGAALPWPCPQRGGSPSRAAGALVVLCDGVLLGHVGRGGKTLTLFPPPTGITQEEAMARVIDTLRGAMTSGVLADITIEKVSGDEVFTAPERDSLIALGARLTPTGLRVAAAATSPSATRRGRNVTDAVRELPGDTDTNLPRRGGGGFGRRR